MDRRGEPQVIIMSIKDYINNFAPAPDFLKEIRAEAKRKGLHKLTMRQIDAEIAAFTAFRAQQECHHPRSFLIRT